MNIWFIGDCHGSPDTIEKFYFNCIKDTPKEYEENWLIMLGDAGLLYYLNKKDDYLKRTLSRLPFKYFVIRGNHEERASNRAKIEPNLWEEVECFGNKCLRQFAFPNIYYAKDEGGIYNIAGRKTLVVPGAYSIDKYYRLQMGWSWFPDEQLTQEEMANLEKITFGQSFDLILSHTCPISCEPTDLFISGIDQSKVDKTMEIWMEKLFNHINFKVALWGHFHADRVEAPRCEMLMHEVQLLDEIEDRWDRYTKTGELDWWLPKAPNFYMFENKKGE